MALLLNGTAPSYFCELRSSVASASGREHLMPASTGLLQVLKLKPGLASVALLWWHHHCGTISCLLLCGNGDDAAYF